LERWRTLEVAAHTLERWHALLLFDFGLTLVLSVGEVAALIPHLAAYFLPLGAPSSKMPCALLFGIFTLCCINM
jgi:hypothetical protein